MSIHKLQRGYGLVEALIVATVLILGAVAIYAFSVRVNAGALAQRESENIANITNSINQSYVAFAHTTPLTTERAIEENLVPNTLSVVGDQVFTSFGGEVNITEDAIGNNRIFTVTYANVPSRICSRVISSTNELNRYSQINVSGANGTKEVARNGVVDHSQVSQLCNSGRNADISFVFNGQQAASGSGPGNSCVLPSPSTETEERDCPTGQVGQIIESRTASCTGPATPSNLAVWSDWEEVVNTCTSVCVPYSPEQVHENCPDGFIGGIVRTRTSSCPSASGAPVWSDWTENNTCVAACEALPEETQDIGCPTGYGGSHIQRRTSSCPASTGSPVWSGWETVNNACEPLCVIPPAQNDVENRPASCNTGRVTPSGGNSFTQSRTVTTSYSCPNVTGSPVAQTTSTNWSPNESSACVAACVAPSAETREIPCAAGYNGVQIQTRTYSCPNITGAPVAGQWATTSNSCVAACQLPNPSRERNTRTTDESNFDYNACPTGQTGYVHYRRTIYQEQFRNASCAPGATSPSWGAWSAWATHNSDPWWIASTACVPSCQPYSYWTLSQQHHRVNTRTVGTCPSGQIGTITESRTEGRDERIDVTCRNGQEVYTNSGVLSDWKPAWNMPNWTYQNTCRFPKSCSLNNFYLFWNVNGKACNGNSPGLVVPHGSTTAMQATRGGTGVGYFTCNDGVFGQAIGGSTCN